jgi:hypothetical protein
MVIGVENPLPDWLRKIWKLFGDLFGDGRIHRIKITNKSVESWASLGWGRFSEKVVFDNAPNIQDFDSKF